MKLPAWTYLVVFLGGAFLMWYCMRGCEKNPSADHVADKVFVDSVVSSQHQKDSAVQKYKDSSDRVIKELKNDKDSLTAIVVSYEKNLKKQGNDISELLVGLANAEAQRDTALALARCDSLAVAVTQAKAAVGAYMNSNDSLRQVSDKIISAKTELANRLNQEFTEANQALFAVQIKYQSLFSDYQKINKSKKWGIGPSAGAFITNKGVGYGIGITLSYNLIKF